MFDNPFSEENFPNIQSKPSLVQLQDFLSCAVTWYLGKETDSHLSTTSFQVAVESEVYACPASFSGRMLWENTESQNVRVWKGPLQVF